jgi:hypothetical protein
MSRQILLAQKDRYGPWEFQSEKWELSYVKRIDATIAALKSAGVPVIWVGLPPSAAQKPAVTRLISMNFTAARPRRRELSMSISGTALSMRRGISRHKDRII